MTDPSSPSSNNNNHKHDATQQSDTMVDETGGGGPVKEVPPVAGDSLMMMSHEGGSSSWKATAIVALVIAVIVVLSAGITASKRNNNNDDDDDASDKSKDLIATWIPHDAPAITPEWETTDSSIPSFRHFDVDDKNLVVAGLTEDHTAQLEWYMWMEHTSTQPNSNVTKTSSWWQHQATLPLGDLNPESHPTVHVQGNVVVVADAQSVPKEQEGLIAPSESYHGLVRVYTLQPGSTDIPTLPAIVLTHQGAQDDLWGNAVDLDTAASHLVVGAPLTDAPSALHAGSLHIYDLNKDATVADADESAFPFVQVGSALPGTHAFDGIGGAGLAISGDGRTVAAGVPLDSLTVASAGAIRLWRWDDETNDWTKGETIIGAHAGMGLGRRVQLNEDGTILVATTMLTNQVVVYDYSCDYDTTPACQWVRKGQFLEGTAAHLQGVRLAVVNDGAVRVYQWSAQYLVWVKAGQAALPGVAAQLTDNAQRMIIQTEQGSLQTWQWVS